MKCAAAILTAALGLFGAANAAERDAWESKPAQRPDFHSCTPVDDELVVVVAKNTRDKAVKLLQERQALALDTNQASVFLGMPGVPVTNAKIWITSQIAKLRRQWLSPSLTADDKQYRDFRLDRLEVESGKAALEKAKPYLLRGVAGFETSGHFFASVCGDKIDLTHGELGRSTPPTVRLPAVIFLEKKPTQVVATWSMAE